MLMLLTALVAVKALAVVGQAWMLASAIDVLRAGAPLSQAVFYLAGFGVFFLSRQAIDFVRDTLLERYAVRAVARLRRGLLGRIFDVGPQFVSGLGTGNAVALALEGAEQVETYLRLVLPKIASVVVIPLVVLVFAFPFDWVSGAIMLVVFPFIVFYMVLLGKTAKAAADRQHDEFNRLANHFVDTLRGIDTLKLFGRSRQQGDAVFEASERLRGATMKTLRTAILSGAVLDLFSTFSLAAVAIMLGFRLVDGTIAFFPALLVLILVPEYFKPIREFASDYHASLDGKTALASYLAALRGPDGVEGGSKEDVPLSKDGSCEDVLPPEDGLQEGALPPEGGTTKASAPRAAFSTEPTVALDGAFGGPAVMQGVAFGGFGETVSSVPAHLWAQGDVLEARGVSFDYADHRALRDVTFRVEGCSRVGIVGMSGSGKSTLVNLLGGFAEPTAGCFASALSGTSAKPFDLGSAAWRGQVVYIPQNPYIFHATLRENIAFYRPDAADDDLSRAVEVCGLQDLVRALPDGLSTRIGEGARALSGGQAQRIALARAFLDPDRRVLLLDEPTAHLDIETELELKERMLPLMESRLVFFATHRLHWVGDMDAVMVMEDGRIAEFGAPGELLRHDGALSRLVERMEGGAR